MVKFKDMNLPNKLTTLRMFCVPIVLILFILHALFAKFGIYTDFMLYNRSMNGQECYLTVDEILIVIVFAAASITDALDGKIARKHNLITDYGKLMDPLADKLLVNTTLITMLAFGFFDRCYDVSKVSYSLQIIASVFAIITIARDIFVDALRMQALKKNAVVPAMIWGKLKTATLMPGVVIMIVGSTYFVTYLAGLIFITLGGIFAVIGGIKYFTSLSKYINEA